MIELVQTFGLGRLRAGSVLWGAEGGETAQQHSLQQNTAKLFLLIHFVSQHQGRAYWRTLNILRARVSAWHRRPHTQKKHAQRSLPCLTLSSFFPLHAAARGKTARDSPFFPLSALQAVHRRIGRTLCSVGC